MTNLEEARRETQREKSIAKGKPIEEWRDYTVAEWCLKRRISKPTFYKMKRLGLGPETITLPGLVGERITTAFDQAWEKKAKQYAKTKTARRLVERRKKAAQNAANISAQSPLHVSRAGKKAFRKAAPPATKQKPKLVAVKPTAPGSSR